MGEPLFLRLLGPAQMELEGQPVSDLQPGKPLALLGYLVAQRQPLSASTWPTCCGRTCLQRAGGPT